MSILWQLKKGGYRFYQEIVKRLLPFIKYPEQQFIVQINGVCNIPEIIEKNKIDRVLLVCSKTVRRHGLLEELFSELQEKKIEYTIFEDVNPNTTTDNIEKGYQCYLESQCAGIIAIGGGSVLDCAKIIAVKVSNPKLTFESMKNMINIKKRIPFLIAVPTTAGTGSESTICAVVREPEEKKKYAIVTPKCMPHVAILDAALMKDLPASFTAYTGMDALTHAIEAYIGRFGTSYTDTEALKAIQLIFENMEKAYQNGDNLQAREKMLIASNAAANAFTRTYVGYIHSISHALSALYNVGHGKTNAIVLPIVLRYYGKTVEKKLAEIARYIGIAGEKENANILAERLIQKIELLNQKLQIPDYVDEIQETEIDFIVHKALREANPAYPVPKIMNDKDCKRMIEKLVPKNR